MNSAVTSGGKRRRVRIARPALRGVAALAAVVTALLIALAVGGVSTFWAPVFPKYVLMLPEDAISGFAAVIVICVLASLIAIRVALKVDPGEAISG